MIRDAQDTLRILPSYDNPGHDQTGRRANVMTASSAAGDLPQRLLEYLHRLAAGNQVALIDDHGRNPVDPLLAVKLLLRADFRGISIGGKDLLRLLRLQSDCSGKLEQHRMIGRIQALREIGVEQRVLERRLPALEFGPMQQAMRIEGVIDALALI